MSFGDPNNPYGAPQGQPPGYGYPQQPGQPGYGYPSAPPVQPYGHPGGPVSMPGSVKAARVMLFVLGGLQALGGLLMVVASGWFAEQLEDILADDPSFTAEDVDNVSSVGAGVMIVFGVIVLAFAAWAILTAAKFGTGRGGTRVSAIIYASVVTLFSVISLLGANIFALVSLVLGILIIVFCANRNGSYWFNRPPQY
ncbi:proline-rich domain-containing protein [Streptomyces sp. MA15]|uniref:proline-rich domain-containing protein n=1 Tax=Streptomyces sp. MA15 TaxID=3055061 RepID=UPI0025B156C1|nr:proline-rich domain-containing protein [Streptomyces sp. MA15]MDN3271001.1 proline-rich domain-containing protein [Streptomyces sp. MA15]